MTDDQWEDEARRLVCGDEHFHMGMCRDVQARVANALRAAYESGRKDREDELTLDGRIR